MEHPESRPVIADSHVQLHRNVDQTKGNGTLPQGARHMLSSLASLYSRAMPVELSTLPCRSLAPHLLLNARRVRKGDPKMARYGKKAQEKVERAMHERKHGTLKSGRSGKTVRSRKQAIAIGLSEARREGGKVPEQKASRKS